MPVLQIEGVTKRYDRTLAVNDVSFSVASGRLFGLLGPNGAGKTTSIRMITYITTPDEGRVLFQGKPVGTWSQERMGYMPEERGLYKKMKIGEQLIFMAELKGLSRSEARKHVQYWLERFGAADWANKKTEELSKGMQQKVQFISTIAHNPDLIILDEPFSGLDPVNAELLREVILELKSAGKTILFASHRMEQVEQMCDDICLIAHGKAVLTGSLRDVKRSFGRNTVEVEFEGSDEWIAQTGAHLGISVKAHTRNRAELVITQEAQAQEILQMAIGAGVAIVRFELMEPSLNEIFIRTVASDTPSSTSTHVAS
ncbi:MAG: ATP-binding cassette domain-containing protein [Bacteroidetes Order II. Incertae sedis bacterium]|nr:ATP-binding cassette domain-containing protein [Bacteroidetes Order II. bacterium]